MPSRKGGYGQTKVRRVVIAAVTKLIALGAIFLFQGRIFILFFGRIWCDLVRFGAILGGRIGRFDEWE
jgi:hypothetical protein